MIIFLLQQVFFFLFLKIQLRANVKGLKIDYIHMRASDRTPPSNDIPEDGPKFPQTPKKMETLFSCPLPPASLESPLCGLTPFPTQDLGSDSRWEDVDSDIITGSIFPGRYFNHSNFFGKGC